jgi:hypothetical protein
LQHQCDVLVKEASFDEVEEAHVFELLESCKEALSSEKLMQLYEESGFVH